MDFNALQEAGALPGQGLTAIQTILYFIAAPIALFSAITAIVLITSADKSKVKSSGDLSRID